MEPTNGGEYILAATKAAPPVTVTGITLAGISLNEWVLLFTLIYTILQIGWFIYDKCFRKGNGS